MARKTRIVITGATGLLGRNLLFEILKQNAGHLDDVEVIVLGRSTGSLTIEERMHQIVLDDGLQYLSGSGGGHVQEVENYCGNGIEYIHGDLDENKLDISSDDFLKLARAPIDHFFHIAALTDFRDTPNVVAALKRTNVYGTQQILDLVAALAVKEFCYVSTAYACGNTVGIIAPDYINLDQRFRNPYEVSKLEAEIMVRSYAKRMGVRCRYFRPSTICGRLIEPRLGRINKFDVFYFWAAFFLRVKLRECAGCADRYAHPLHLAIRLCYNEKSGLNIVPADYAAKVMYQVCMQGCKGDSFYLVNNEETPHARYIALMLKTLNISGPRRADGVPHDMNKLEQLYYKTVGKVFTPYIDCEPMVFDTGNLATVLDAAGLACPRVDDRNFSILMDYAREHDFGVEVKGAIPAEANACGSRAT